LRGRVCQVSQTQGGNHAEHHASSGSVVAAKKEKYNCLVVTQLRIRYWTVELDSLMVTPVDS